MTVSHWKIEAERCINVAELTPEEWADVAQTAKDLMRRNMGEVERNFLERISRIKTERDYLNACDEYDNLEDCINTELKTFLDTLDNVIDTALLGEAYALPYMG